MDKINASTRDQLRAFVQRVERLNEEKAALAADIKEIYAEAKSFGFDVKTLRAVVRLRKQDANERSEAQALLDTYLTALGMQPDVFDAASEAEPEGSADDGKVVPLKQHEPQAAE